MREQEWLTCTDPAPMLEFLQGKASERKLRLFAVACCRRIWHLLTDERSRKAVEVAERYADGCVSEEELRAVSGEAASVGIGFGVQFSAANAAHFAALPGQVRSNRCAMFAARALAEAAAPAAQAGLLRCIFGIPFHPITVSPDWLTATVVSLAQAIYQEKAFARLPLLAGALEEAGCTNADILTHCRQPSEHVRGCLVVDLLLTKE
jgi:hypothetical protein